MKIALANSQMFQALYIDTDAEKSEDRITLIEELVESLPEAQQILTTSMKEPYYGMVIAGSNIAISKFRSKIYDLDKKENLGTEEISEMLAKIAEVAFDQKCEVVFFKGPVEHKGIPQIMKNTSVAIDLKGIFDPQKIKEGGKEFWKNLIGFDKELEKKYNKLDLKEHKKIMDYLEKNEKSIEGLNEAIRDNHLKTPTIDKMTQDLEVRDYEEYLGPDYDGLVYYKILRNDFDNATKFSSKEAEPAPVDDNATEEEKKGEFPFDKPAAADPRKHLLDVLKALPTVHGKPMEPSNIRDVGKSIGNNDSLLLALERPTQYSSINWWPREPIKATREILAKYDWLKNKKDDKVKDK